MQPDRVLYFRPSLSASCCLSKLPQLSFCSSAGFLLWTRIVSIMPGADKTLVTSSGLFCQTSHKTLGIDATGDVIQAVFTVAAAFNTARNKRTCKTEEMGLWKKKQKWGSYPECYCGKSKLEENLHLADLCLFVRSLSVAFLDFFFILVPTVFFVCIHILILWILKCGPFGEKVLLSWNLLCKNESPEI